MSNDSVANSRRGDVFHYRWAARRCLRLLYPNSNLESVVIEGSSAYEKAGEYGIDLTEYTNVSSTKTRIDYYQLKHTTVQRNIPFTLSNLRKTFEHFAARFIQHDNSGDESEVYFSIVTNRPFSESLKQNLEAIKNGQAVEEVFRTTLEKYTTLTTKKLAAFCQLIRIEDGEGDYKVQELELQFELSQLLAGTVDTKEVENIFNLVQSKVLETDGRITKEEVLSRFGFTSSLQLYPAPAVWDKLENIIEREQNNTLRDQILKATRPVVIQADGGVGKSVFCQQVLGSLQEGSLGIAYDCFGAGKYRNPSEPRHGHRHALVQIANELATKGLCNPLLALNTTSNEQILQAFLQRIGAAVDSLRKANATASLVILIDAADNAEMAAKEFNNQVCFANELLRVELPEGCQIALLCRPGRVHLLHPNSYNLPLKLEPFSKAESLQHLRKWYPAASEKDGAEFHRLTSSNPRVQANALAVRYQSIIDLLTSLGPLGTTVEQQIEQQLNAAILRLKDTLTAPFQADVNELCIGLASLPPHIPLPVLAAATNITLEEVIGFVTDIGRALWIYDSSVQFRDEPTEYWFQKTFLASQEKFETYVAKLEPLANSFSYVAEVLPQLYLKAGQYDKLIKVALSDGYLPVDNPIEARNIRVFRLQFAFHAALRQQHYKDAILLALQAGEEVAGTQRQMDLLQSNIHLLVALQSKEKVQDIAFKRVLSGNWDGSENVYTAALLSAVKEYQGEARGYLRAALNWMGIYFRKRQNSDDDFEPMEVNDSDLLELAYAHFNLNGISDAVNFLKRFTSKEWIFDVIRKFARRLIDTGDFPALDVFLHHCHSEPYFTVAACSELIAAGKFPSELETKICLNILCTKKGRIEKPQTSFDDSITPAILSFVECCVYWNLSAKKMLQVLEYYLTIEASHLIVGIYAKKDRTIFCKALAIKTILTGKVEVNLTDILPKATPERKKNYESDGEYRQLKETILGLMPWFMLRTRLLSTKDLPLIEVSERADSASKAARVNRYDENDHLTLEIATVCASILTLSAAASESEISLFYDSYLKKNRAFEMESRFATLHSAYRNTHLSIIREDLELSTYDIVESDKDNGPDEIAGRYISLARAVLVHSTNEASYYFDEAVRAVSKFGDELVPRWEAVVSLAKQTYNHPNLPDQLAYRFIRCAELVGQTVSREKHWHRNEAVQVCAKMSPGVAVAALSRWRDREVGHYFDSQLKTLFRTLLQSKNISVTEGWALTRLFFSHGLNEYLKTSLQLESSKEKQHALLDDAVHLLQMEGADKAYWGKLKAVASEFQLNNAALHLLASVDENKDSELSAKPHPVESDTFDNFRKELWEDVFEKFEVTLKGVNELIKRFNRKTETASNTFRLRSLLKEAVKRISSSDFVIFVDLLLQVDAVEKYDLLSILQSIPTSFKKRISFKKDWPNLLYRTGKRYAHDLVNWNSFEYYIEKLELNEEELEQLKRGVFSGLSQQDEFTNADAFFSFANLAASLVEQTDAIALVDFALSRFELHIEPDFGDGAWEEWLQVSKNPRKNIAGYIWSALSSIRAAVRWNAVHTVRKLAETGCIETIGYLVDWLQHNGIDAFGSKEFHFYNLHAKQYLLIAFARISIDNPGTLKSYSDLLSTIALEEQHAIIQYFASITAIRIEKAYPGTYNHETIDSLLAIGKSTLPVQQEDYDYTTDSYWHKHTEVDLDIDFYFGSDLEEDWFQPLGEVFGLPTSQIRELAAHVIVKEWQLTQHDKYKNDPRQRIWSRSDGRYETSHRDGNYPKVDTLNFYLAHHAMMVVAARLLQKMPVITRKDWYDNDWEDWLSGHLLTREDEKWLADARSAPPIKRPKWIAEGKSEAWYNTIPEDDFYRCLVAEQHDGTWLTVGGSWQEKEEAREETVTITSAWVSKESADALLRALSTCTNPHRYKLPELNEDSMEIDTDGFILTGWIDDNSPSAKLDKHDPYANDIKYPLYDIADFIKEPFHLTTTEVEGTWYSNDLHKYVIAATTWSSEKDGNDEEQNQYGKCLRINLSFLKHLCETLSFELIVEVEIMRDNSYRHRGIKREYGKPVQRIFILSADGKLRTTESDYQLG